MNCSLEGRDVFAGMPTGLGKSFSASPVLQSDPTDRTEEDLRRRVSKQCDSSYLPAQLGLIEDQIKEGKPFGLTCSSLQD